MPSGGLSRYHLQRLAEQERGGSTYLVAWIDDRPIGHLNLKWTGCEIPEVAAVFGDAPEINALGVAALYQSNGIGTALIQEAERLVHQAGRSVALIGVGVDNPRARCLYERLGYRDWGRGTVVGRWKAVLSDGSTIEESEECVYLSKEIAPSDA